MKQSIAGYAKRILEDTTKVRDIFAIDFSQPEDYIEKTTLSQVDLATGQVKILMTLEKSYYYENISQLAGVPITGEYQLLSYIGNLSNLRKSYEKVADAMQSVEQKGYGVVSPELSDITMEEPVLIRHGNKFGVKMKALSPSIHMIRANIETEIAPIVGSEEQAQDLIAYIKEGQKTKEGVFETNIFGKSIGELMEDGMRSKIAAMDDECQLKLQDTMQKIVNDNKIELEDELNLPANFSLENNGEIYGEKLIANSNAVATNNNIMRFTTISLINTTFNNACSLEATTSFYANGATFNFTQGYLKAPTMEFVNGTVNLSNGSMLDATTSIYMNTAHAKFYGKGENTSMIKSPVITGQGFTYDGNLVIECDNHVEKSPYWNNFHVQNGAYFTRMGESKVVIDVCTGTKNNGNEGEEPEDPKFPIIMDDTRNYAYLFEDQWPLYGDYDMNDLVLIIKERKISINKDNKAEEFTLSLDLSAAGATKSIGAAIMLDGVPASAITQPVEFSDNSLFKGFNVNSNLIENGQDYAVIPLFDDAHKALGRDRYEQINTIKDHSANTNPKNISFTIKFSNPISVDELNINKLNVFIFVEGNRNQRKEIHIVGYQPTKLANTDLFGGNNDDSSTSRKRYYISKDNLAWGIMVPTDFKWPLEYVNIKSAYSLFESWVTSGGTKNEEWWKTFDSSRVYK